MFSTPHETEQLLSEMKKGSARAFDQFYEQYASFVLHIALKMMCEHMEAEDVCHDVFLEVFRHIEQFDGKRGSMESWLAVKTKSRCLDRLRRKQRIQMEAWTDSCQENEATATANVEDQVVSIWQRNTLQEALNKIPKDQRTAVYGMYFESKTQKELSEKMGRPLGTVKSLVKYGLHNLRKQLGQWGWAGAQGGVDKHE